MCDNNIKQRNIRDRCPGIQTIVVAIQWESAVGCAPEARGGYLDLWCSGGIDSVTALPGWHALLRMEAAVAAWSPKVLLTVGERPCCPHFQAVRISTYHLLSLLFRHQPAKLGSICTFKAVSL